MPDVTRMLSAIEQGDPSAAEQLLPLVYDELRKLAAQRLAHEKPGQTLQATALVHEAYLRLVTPPAPPFARGGGNRLPSPLGWRGGRPAGGEGGCCPLEQPRPLLRRRRRGDAANPRRKRTRQSAGETRRRLAARRFRGTRR